MGIALSIPHQIHSTQTHHSTLHLHIRISSTNSNMSTIIAPIPTTPITPINLGYESDSGSSVCGDVFSDMSDLSSSEETDVDSVASVDSEVEDSYVSDDEPSYLSDRRDLANPTVLRRPPMG